MDHAYTILPLGEAGLLVRFGSAIRPDIHRCVKALVDQLDRHPFPGLIETVISYTSLAVYYDPFRVRQSGGPAKTASAFQSVSRFLKEEAIPLADTGTGAAARTVEIPVCYGGECGPDLPFVAEHCGLSEEEVIRIHTEPEYLVYMIGFCPGFPYLGGMDKRIATPRRQTPRLAIPARSIGIAGEQTGGYPFSTPGGWQIIGRTPEDLFRPDREDDPSLLHAGDIVRFRAISMEEYLAQRGDEA